MKCLVFLCLIGLLVTCAAAASAAMYSFTNIIDSSVAAPTGNYLSFGDAAISGNKVAFKAGFSRGFSGFVDSILTSSGGPRTEVALTLMGVDSGTIDAIGRPSIEGQDVYFDARVYLGAFNGVLNFGDGAFYGHGQRHVNGNLLVDTAVRPRLVPVNAPYKVVADPLISQGFLTYLSSANTIGIVNPERTTFTRIVGAGDAAPSGGTFSSIDANYGLSGGTVTFRGLYGSQDGIFIGAGGPLTTIAMRGDSTPSGETFNSVLDPAISGGTVAFLGAFAGGSGIFTGDGGALSTVVKTGDATPSGNPFSGFSVPAIAFNMLAFRGEHSGGGGIYTKRGDELAKVVEIGDSLFGSTVANLNFSDLGLDRGGSGNLAFNYGLTDGRTGVAMAVPGPGLPTIYQLNGEPVPDSVGIVFVPVADFAGRSLTNANLGGADLRNAKARNVNLTGANMRQTDLTNADLRGAKLSGARLDSARLDGANFDGADLTGARLRREFVPVVECFVATCTVTPVGHGGITPAQLSATANYRAHNLSGINFEGNNFTNADLTAQNLAGVNLSFAQLAGADLRGAEIRGASFGRYSIEAEVPLCSNTHPCTEETGIIGTGLTVEQLYSTASYLAHDLTGINFGGNYLPGANLAEQNLTKADFSGNWLYGSSPGANLANANLSHAILFNASFWRATLAGANLSGADARGASFTDAVLTDAVLTNLIRSDGRVSGLDLGPHEMLRVRDYGDPAHGVAPLPITVDQHFAMGTGGTLRMVFEADPWDSTISFQPGIPVTLGGTLELTFATDVDLASQVGRTFDVFDWTGVNPTGQFQAASPYGWDLSNLYTTGEVTLTAVPEPGSIALAGIGLLTLAVARVACRRYTAARAPMPSFTIRNTREVRGDRHRSAPCLGAWSLANGDSRFSQGSPFKHCIVASLFLLGASFFFAPLSAWAVTIDTVPVGNVGNGNDASTGNRYGGVSYAYRIGTTEVTNAQYADFLNAKAASDPLDLYNAGMVRPERNVVRRIVLYQTSG